MACANSEVVYNTMYIYYFKVKAISSLLNLFPSGSGPNFFQLSKLFLQVSLGELCIRYYIRPNHPGGFVHKLSFSECSECKFYTQLI